MNIRRAISGALGRGSKMFLISFVAALTSALSVYQEKAACQNPPQMDPHRASESALTAFLVAFASSALHLLENDSEKSSAQISEIPPQKTTPSGGEE